MTMGRLVGLSALALGVGFGGGIWFISSGAGFRLIGGPTASTAGARSAGQTGGVQQRPNRSTGYGGSGSFLMIRADRNDLQPSAGCEWVLEPVPLHLYFETSKYDLRAQDVLRGTALDWMAALPERGLYGSFALDSATGGVRYTLVEFTTRGRRALDLRPVFFDRAGNRHVPAAASQSRTQNAGDEVMVSEFILDPAKAIPREEVVYCGIERVVSDGERQVIEAAQTAARNKGMMILPAPQIGKPYNFDLTTVDGKRLRAEDFRGKAVLIGVWDADARSSWLTLWLQGIRKAYNDDEIGFIGISFDESVAKAQATLNKSMTASPLVVIPNDPKIHDLWCKGAQITRFPFYFLIDREGILRYTSPYHRLSESFHMRESVDILFGRLQRFGFMRTMTGPPRLQPPPKTKSRPSQPDPHSEPSRNRSTINAQARARCEPFPVQPGRSDWASSPRFLLRIPCERPTMITTGRTAAVTIVSLALGFVGGAWFVGSDVGLRFVPAPKLSTPVAGAGPTKPTARTKPTASPETAVQAPWPVRFRGGENGLMPKTERTDLLPAPGCNWVIEPRPFQPYHPWVVTSPGRALFGNSELEGRTGSLRSILIQSVRQDAAKLDLRPVFFDEEGTRYVPTTSGRGQSSSHDGELRSLYPHQDFAFRWFEQPPREKLVYFGIEQVAPNAEQLLAAAAQKAAKDKGMLILPTPQIGKPYNFDLTTVDGKRLRAEDFRGKEVLIGISGPETSSAFLTTALKDLRKANNDHEFSFVGVSFEESVEKARSTFAGSGTADALVVVPNDAKIQRIWREGAQIIGNSTCFFLDNNGNLQATGHYSQVMQSLNVRSGRTPFGYPKPKQPGLTKKAPPAQPGRPPRN